MIELEKYLDDSEASRNLLWEVLIRIGKQTQDESLKFVYNNNFYRNSKEKKKILKAIKKALADWR